PMVSALFCKLFGLSVFNVCLGTAFLGMLLLPVIYAWGQDAGGRTAGLAALIFALVGPVGYFHHLASPRGGYALTLLLGTLILWLSGRLAVREFRNYAVSPGGYALLGLLAGVGWWTNQLIAASLVTAAIILLIALRTRIFTWRLPFGLAGFMVGSLPWWLWNFRHSWESLGFMGSLGRTPAGEGLKLFFAARFPDLMDLVAVPLSIRIAGLTGIAVLVAIAAWSCILCLLRCRKGRLTWPLYREEPTPACAERSGEGMLAAVSLITVFLFIAVSALLFCRAHFATFNTARYLLPIIPALAVLVGTATAFLVARARYGLGWAPLLLLLAFQVWNARFTLEMHRNHTWEVLSQTLERSLAPFKVEAVFCDYIYHWMNAASGERLCLVDIIGERYQPYEWRGEMARQVAFCGNIGEVAAFITNTGGAARSGEVMTFPVYCDLKPPRRCALVPSLLWASAVDQRGHNVLAAISDGNLQTRWQAPVLTNAGPWIEIHFKEPIAVQGVRFLSDSVFYPPAWVVEGQVTEEWKPLTAVMPINGYFWSGPRPYWNGIGFRPECRFKPETVSRLRVRFMAPDRESEVYVSELTVFGGKPEPESAAETDALASLLAMLRERGIRRLYSDRWIANEVAAATTNVIVTMREPAVVERHPGDPVRPREWVLPAIRLDQRAAILALAEEAPVCRQSLKARRVELRETVIGPWVLFDFAPDLSRHEQRLAIVAPDQWQLRYAADSGLFWTGFNVLTGKQVAKRYARELRALAGHASSKAEALALLEEARRMAPGYALLLQQLAAAYRESGEVEKAADLEMQFARLTFPGTPARATFGRGIEFLGVTLNPVEARPGGSADVWYYWRCPPDLAAAQRPIVFVHFKKDGRRFQDDHALLVGMNPDDIACQDVGEVLIEKRTVAIPPDTVPGMYEIRLGLIDAGTKKRWAVRTDLSTRHRAVRLPVKLQIQ
ncbi:MAG: hypothetical protein KKE37_13365, partial [Verrucomicrobia bacterium]|nr:hypothetical protein [Verrucomicrobiota bacterium]